MNNQASDYTKISLAGGGGSTSVSSGSYSSSSSHSSSGSHGGDGTFGIFDMIILGVFFVVFVLIFIFAQKRRNSPSRFRMVAGKPLDENRSKLVSDTFIKFQADWSALDTDSMRNYMTERYHQHNVLMVNALKQAKRQNQVDNVKVYAVGMTDEDVALGTLRTVINISATDIINDTRSGAQLFSQRVALAQYYKFIQSEGKLLLDGVDTDTAAENMRNRSLEEFAANEGYFYSLDWGWLLLPQKGQLFGSGSFGVSDINNHIIGQMEDVILQVYTYAPAPGMPSYLIAQVPVPKDYGDILVQRKGPNRIIPRGLKEVKTEWNDFNQKYSVHASDIEQITSLELLHPVFMEKLEALPFEVNIEVVDNVVYLFTSDTNPENYKAMLGILKDAYREMKR